VKVCLACDARFESAGWTCPVCGCAPRSNGHLQFAPEFADAGSGFDVTSFGLLERIEETSFWFRSRNRLIAWALERYFPSARSLLEIGCGTGYVLSALRERFPVLRLTGSEIFAAGLELAARRLHEVTLFQMDARCLPFDEEFDVIGAFDVLEHIEEDDVVLDELHRAVKRGGGVLLTVPQHPTLWSAVDDFAQHQRRYRRGELAGKLERAGFTVKRQTSFMSLLIAPMAASRLRQRRVGSNAFDPLTEYRLSRPIDAALERVLTAERVLIRAGVSLPVGGSLLVVAERR
jgi:ubiquinone/menaquinone biosynthesis C-methylase UbiE